jgi:hypothetical protein
LKTFEGGREKTTMMVKLIVLLLRRDCIWVGVAACMTFSLDMTKNTLPSTFQHRYTLPLPSRNQVEKGENGSKEDEGTFHAIKKKVWENSDEV